ncbi:Hsp20/alpha crystallin family protein [bacterium]|nr:Hsp20/alpha crystallin family protein [bacterium]
MKTQIPTERPNFKTRAHKEGFDLDISLPGVKKKDLEVNLARRLLTINGNRRELDGNFERREQEALRFELKVEIHEDVDDEKIQVTHRDGILTLSLQRRQELAPRKIDILAN